MGHDVRVHRDFYRLPTTTTQIAKVSKILLALDKGNLPHGINEDDLSDDSDSEPNPRPITGKYESIEMNEFVLITSIVFVDFRFKYCLSYFLSFKNIWNHWTEIENGCTWGS